VIGVIDVPTVLFVCVHNAGTLADDAGLPAKYVGSRIVVRSAGSTPADEVNSGVEAMREVDVSHEFPKALTDEAVEASAVVTRWDATMPVPSCPGSYEGRLPHLRQDGQVRATGGRSRGNRVGKLAA